MTNQQKACPFLLIARGDSILCICGKCAWYWHGDCALYEIAGGLRGVGAALGEMIERMDN